MLVQTLTLVWSLEQVISCWLHALSVRVSSKHLDVDNVSGRCGRYDMEMEMEVCVCIESVTSGALPVTLL